MESFFKALERPEYVHVLINHLPLTGLVAALLGLGCAWVLGNRAGIFVGLVLVSLFALSAWPVSEYGEAGFDRVLSMADDDGAAYLKHHRDLADRWVWLFYVTAGAGAAAVVAGWKWPKALRLFSVAVTLLALASLLAGAVIAECGGKVRHREFRTGPAPADAESRGANILLNPRNEGSTKWARQEPRTTGGWFSAPMGETATDRPFIHAPA